MSDKAKRAAVWKALWADKLYCRVHARMERWNKRISECLAYPRIYTADDLATARRRFKSASRMMHRLEHGALSGRRNSRTVGILDSGSLMPGRRISGRSC